MRDAREQEARRRFFFIRDLRVALEKPAVTREYMAALVEQAFASDDELYAFYFADVCQG